MIRHEDEFRAELAKSPAAAVEWLWDHAQNYDTFSKDDFCVCMSIYSAELYRSFSADRSGTP